MDTGASAIDHPDPTIVDFVESSRLMPRGMSASGDSMGYSGEPESSSGVYLVSISKPSEATEPGARPAWCRSRNRHGLINAIDRIPRMIAVYWVRGDGLRATTLPVCCRYGPYLGWCSLAKRGVPCLG